MQYVIQYCSEYGAVFADAKPKEERDDPRQYDRGFMSGSRGAVAGASGFRSPGQENLLGDLVAASRTLLNQAPQGITTTEFNI